MPGASAQQLPERIQKAGKVIVANQPIYPPMEFKDPKTNQFTGFDVDLANALAKQLGIVVEWSETSFEQMTNSLKSGRVDIIQSAMSDLPSRREAFDFLDYVKSGPQFFTLFERRNEFQSMDDLCGKKLGMSRVTSFPAETARWSKVNCEEKGKPAITILGTEGSADARNQLRQHRVDAAVQGVETLPYLMKQEPDTYFLIGPPFATVYQGIAFDKAHTQLRDAYATALKTLIDSGTYKSILEKWDLGSNALDGVYINGEPVK
ncbi:ABC transporter substrate-binding protein [Bradyrhizobium sp. LTSP885]|uniref:ABC transporter substrate-binding protein n=1 Tax=Bradyrhizobium sp. LTSP885 TaxID=1619232 RepID=UPI00069974C6|nr:ABC transporter substrate-binding protein [Bradyrhizobium sp. LTSP885]